MAEVAFISTNDLAAWLGDELDDERASAIVKAASAVVSSHIGAWQYPDGTPKDVPEIVKLVTRQVAARIWRNPAGVRQETTGPFSTTYSAGDGGVDLTDSEIKLLGHLTDSPSGGGLWTLSTTRGPDVEPVDRRPVEGGGDPIRMFADPPW